MDSWGGALAPGSDAPSPDPATESSRPLRSRTNSKDGVDEADATDMTKPENFGLFNPRMCLGCQTGVETSIATPGPFLGLRPSPLLCEKALDALYNFPAA